MKKVISILILALASGLCYGQTVFNSREAGQFNAAAYNWGDRIIVTSGNATTGSASIVLQWGSVTLQDGRELVPFATNAPLVIGTGTTVETVTPTAVSGCAVGRFANNYQTCTITASFANVHGAGEVVSSGTFGLQEAINDAAMNSVKSPGSGGVVVVDKAWAIAGGTQTILTAASLAGNFAAGGGLNIAGLPPVVTVSDMRGFPVQQWAPRPSTLSLIAAGAALTLTQSAGGSLTSSGTYRVSYEYVDPLLGISLPGTTSAQITLTGSNQTITTSVPVASAGAVGYIPMITASAGADGTQIEVPVTSAVCTLSVLTIAGKPTCAMGSAATITANPSATAKEVLFGTAHTTFAPFPATSFAAPFQTSFGPFTAVATVTAGSSNDVAQFFIPSAYLNFLSKSFDVCPKLTGTNAATAIPTLNLTASNQYAQSPVNLGALIFATQTGAVTTEACFTVQTNTIGASGKFMVSGTGMSAIQSSGATVPGSDVSAAASSTLDLTSGLYFAINLAATTANITAVTVNSVTIKPSSGN